MIRNKYVVEAIAFTSYVLFAMAWVAGTTNMGQIMDAMGVTSLAAGSMLSGAVTLAKIVGTFIAALIAVKLGVKYAFLVSGLMIGLGVISPYSPNYDILLVSRFLMGLGGALMVVYFNPIVLRWFEAHERPIVNGLNAVAFNVGTAIVIWLSGDMNEMFGGWKNTLTVISVASIVLAILWALVDYSDESTGGAKDASAEEVEKFSYSQGLKDRFIWAFSFTYAGIIALYIGLFTFGPKAGISLNTVVMSAGIVGTLVGIAFSRRYPQRVPVIRWSGFLLALSSIGLLFGKSELLQEISAFALGFFIFFPITALFTIPHELPKMTGDRITVIFSLFYSISYIFSTVVLWVFGRLYDYSGNYQAGFAMLCVCATTFFLGSFFLPETKKDA